MIEFLIGAIIVSIIVMFCSFGRFIYIDTKKHEEFMYNTEPPCLDDAECKIEITSNEDEEEVFIPMWGGKAYKIVTTNEDHGNGRHSCSISYEVDEDHPITIKYRKMESLIHQGMLLQINKGHTK